MGKGQDTGSLVSYKMGIPQCKATIGRGGIQESG